MAYNDVIILRDTPVDGIDDAGDRIFKDPVDREIFARVDSIGRSEFYQAHAAGLKPEIKFTIADGEDYHGEMTVVYCGTIFHVLRTYQAGNELEIVCYRGSNRAGAEVT